MRAGKAQAKRGGQRKQQQYRKERKDDITVKRNRKPEHGAKNSGQNAYRIWFAVVFGVKESRYKNQKVAGEKRKHKASDTAFIKKFKECSNNYIY